jgi:MscS family membrane protein
MRFTRLALVYTCLALAAAARPCAALAGQVPAVRQATAAEAAAPTAAPQSEPPLETPDSPRASARTFIDLTTRKGDFARAARYLVLPAEFAERGPDLARRIGAVIEQHIVANLDSLSPFSEGNEDDDLPRHVDRAGSIVNAAGEHEPIYIVRRVDKDGAFWAVSHDTVARVDDWYDALPDRWVRDWMPQRLQRHGPFGVLWWQWLALPVLALAAYALGRLLGGLAARLLRRIFTKTRTHWDDRLLRRTEPALRLLVAVGSAAVLLPFLALLPSAEVNARLMLGAVATVAAFWALWLSVDVWRQFLMDRPWMADNPSARSLLSVAINFVKLIVAVGGVLALLAVFGYPVATVLAGLGIGGIALAFGAQKTIENLFGSISLAADQPFRVGDFVTIEGGSSGHVEQIGMRSTQIRTLDRTVVTLPNGKLSEMRIEGFGTRDRIRFATTVTLVYGTTEAQIRQVVLEIERLLRGVPEIWPDNIVSTFSTIGASSLDVEVMCWFQTRDFGELRRIRQEVLLGILKIVDDAGTSLAFPTTTLHVASGLDLPRPEPSPPEETR